jgi:hypothetical protein
MFVSGPHTDTRDFLKLLVCEISRTKNFAIAPLEALILGGGDKDGMLAPILGDENGPGEGLVLKLTDAILELSGGGRGCRRHRGFPLDSKTGAFRARLT